MKTLTMLMPVLMLSIAMIASAGDAKKPAGPVNVDANDVALKGHDVVALFGGSVTPGDATITAVHNGAIYRFSTAENRDAFNADPAKFEPQYGGYCALGVTKGAKAPVELSTATVVDGKLYLNYNAAVQATWDKARADYIRDADTKWPEVSQKN